MNRLTSKRSILNGGVKSRLFDGGTRPEERTRDVNEGRRPGFRGALKEKKKKKTKKLEKGFKKKTLLRGR